MNPIFIEYYSHENCDCYKIKLPYPRYGEEKIVLCKVEEGFDRAQTYATGVLVNHIHSVLERDKPE